MRLAQIAESIGGTLIGDGDVEITGVAGIREAGNSDLTFLANPRYEPFLATTAAGAVVVAPDAAPCPRPVIHAANPYLAYVHAMKLLCGNGRPGAGAGIHPSAAVSPEARLGAGVSVGPHAVIEAGAVVGERSFIGALAYVGADAELGPDCVLHAGSVVRERCVLGARVILESGAVIGGDGFGYVWDGERHLKIPHLGRVVLEDEVEVGSNATVDRGTTGETRIRKGTKVDNLVQIAHNVQIGEYALLAGQVGVSGSTEIGNRAILAGQVGVVGHIQIGDNAFVGAKSGVDKSVPAGQFWWGSPAKDRSRVLRERAALSRLPELLKHIKTLEARIEDLEKNRKP